MTTKELHHLYWRAGFGIGYSSAKKLEGLSREEVVKKLFSDQTSYNPIDIDFSVYKEAIKNINSKKRTSEQKKIEQKYFKKKSKDLNLQWIEHLTNSDAILREKMTLFWANVFVCADNNAFFLQNYNNTLRKNALGNFGDFVKAIAHEASMNKYLNNKQNRKDKPNENFARELMELFTLGAGNYTEQDIKESARAFTGWNNKRDGSYVLIDRHHDSDEKTFFEKTGNFDGDDIIDIILEQKQCSKYICTKIYKYFVNPKINKKRLKEITNLFYQDYDIEKLMLHIFNSDWFYDDKNIGVKIKSPIELLVGIRQVVPVKFTKPKQLFYIQKMTGQILFKPDNVSGWKGDQSWIDSNTLMFRLKLASLVLNQAQINLQDKGELEDTFEEFYNKKKKSSYLKTEVSWNIYYKEHSKLSPEDLKELLILSEIDSNTDKLLTNLKVENIKDYCIQLMSIPEYQLC